MHLPLHLASLKVIRYTGNVAHITPIGKIFMTKQRLLICNALALAFTGSVFAGGVDHTAASVSAPAAQSGGFYIGLNGGYILPAGKYKFTAKDVSNGSTVVSEMHNFTREAKSAYGFGAAVGYRFGGVPVKVEAAFDYTIFNLTDHAKQHADNEEAYSVMARAFYDFNMGRFVPYVGLGIGYDNHIYKDKARGNLDGAGIGYEGIIGSDYLINNNLSVGARFTYHATTAKNENTSPRAPGEVSTKNTFDYSGISFLTASLVINYYF